MGVTSIGNLKQSEGARARFHTPSSEAMAEQLPRIKDEQYRPVVMRPGGEGRYRFRTHAKLERKSFQIRLRLPQAMPDSDKWPEAYRQYRGWIDRQLKMGKIRKDELINHTSKIIEADSLVRDEIGRTRIVFRRIHQSRECAFETDSLLVANYIRMRMKRGDFPEIYEDVKPLEIRIGGRTIRVEGHSDEDQRAIAEFLASNGGSFDADVDEFDPLAELDPDFEVFDDADAPGGQGDDQE